MLVSPPGGGADHRSTVGILWIKALIYMLLVGGVHFVAVPALILKWEQKRSIVAFRPRSVRLFGVAVLGLGAALAVVSCHFLVTRGKGTPFPLDSTLELVTTGPYRFVRNPQAIAATLIVAGEVAAIRSRSLWILLPVTLLYLEGLARPIEERQLAQRFGETYLAYQSEVPRWIPRRGRRDILTDDGSESAGL